VDYAPSQDVAANYPEIPAEQFELSVVFIEPDGRITTGAHAVLRAYAQVPLGKWPLALYEKLPGFAGFSEWGYRFVASHRKAFSRLTLWLWGRVPEPSSWHLTRSVFIRSLGLVYLIAFTSLWVQIDGLIGSSGLIPADQVVERMLELARQRDANPYQLSPTLSLYLKGDAGLHAQCATGVVFSIALMLGFLPGLFLLLLWVLYLSLTVIGTTFLGFQWENLLLETGLIAIFLCPWRLRLPNGPTSLPQTASRVWLHRGLEGLPGGIARLLLWWLLFRLMLQSGMVKLASNDDVWWNLTALTHHYWTQPLATWTSYYVHHMPLWFHKFCCIATYIIEIGFPFLMLGPRRVRMLAFWGFALLMGMIAFTGNYTYFNLLTFVLCLLLVDDQSWPQKWRHRFASAQEQGRATKRPRMSLPVLALPAVATVACIIILLMHILPISWIHTHATTYGFLRVTNNRLETSIDIPRPRSSARLDRQILRARPFRSINSYGLFANMTETRPEIIIEGSRDLVTWEAYEFKYKPGALNRRPAFVQPHQPRLDWQMWFAALSHAQGQPWLISLINHMLRGTPEVLALLDTNPFGDQPPIFIRATTYDYEFTSLAEKRETGNWWTRSNPRPYTPIITLQNNQLVTIPPPPARPSMER
jgi:hypothetical protein